MTTEHKTNSTRAGKLLTTFGEGKLKVENIAGVGGPVQHTGPGGVAVKAMIKSFQTSKGKADTTKAVQNFLNVTKDLDEEEYMTIADQIGFVKKPAKDM